MVMIFKRSWHATWAFLQPSLCFYEVLWLLFLAFASKDLVAYVFFSHLVIFRKDDTIVNIFDA